MEIKIVKQILEWNEDVSREVRETLAEKRVFMINVMGSPGAGKTSLITAVIKKLGTRFKFGVIEGDIAGSIDAAKIGELGVPVVQLQTDGACHIEAMSIRHMLPMFELSDIDVLFIENIGNLVCPAEFDLGEDMRITLLSVPEGDDKAEKYPLMFATSDAVVINKYDMLPYFDFDDARFEKTVSDLNAKARVFRVSPKTGQGADELSEFLSEKINSKIK